jgi:hypothetical protein
MENAVWVKRVPPAFRQVSANVFFEEITTVNFVEDILATIAATHQV